jgi:membrane-associated phospholipid phosphatase
VSGERDLPTVLWDYELNRAIDGVLPDPVSDGFALATHLGDTAVVAGLLLLFFWFGRAEHWQARGLLVAIVVAALTLNVGLKGVLDVQRPLYAARAAGEPLTFAPESYDGFSTPSGHAMGTAAVYGGLAVLADIGRRWQRYLVAGAVIAGVAFSRVVIGVHYVGDVVLGVALGLGLVWLGCWLSTNEARRVLSDETGPAVLLFALALGGAVIAAPLGSETYAAASIGTSAGGLAVWWRVRERRPDPSRGAVVLCVLPVAGTLLLVAAVDAVAAVDIVGWLGSQSPVASTLRAVLAAAVVGLVLAIPVVADRVDDDPRARWLQRRLPSDGRPADVEEPDERTEDPSD